MPSNQQSLPLQYGRSISKAENKNICVTSLLVGGLVHLIPVLILFYYITSVNSSTKNTDELSFSGSVGGGGGGEGKESIIEFGESGSQGDDAPDIITDNARFTLLKIRILTLESIKPPVKKEIKPKKKISNTPKYIPTRRIRGVGPGRGGGTGGGEGGGIGKGKGFSIDWGGDGSRRLLNGRLPKYPDDSDKEMPVTLEFTVYRMDQFLQLLPQ